MKELVVDFFDFLATRGPRGYSTFLRRAEDEVTPNGFFQPAVPFFLGLLFYEGRG